MERLKDMATAGVSAVAAARAAKASVRKRYGGGSGYEEDKQGDDDDDHDLANNVYDELARFQVIFGVFCCFGSIERDEERVVCSLSIIGSLWGIACSDETLIVVEKNC